MVRTPVQTNHMCDCPNHLHIDVVGTAASSHEIAKTMLHSVVARRTQLIELAVGLDATMEIPDGGGGTSICDLLL
jgi:hypothetical protein